MEMPPLTRNFGITKLYAVYRISLHAVSGIAWPGYSGRLTGVNCTRTRIDRRRGDERDLRPRHLERRRLHSARARALCG